LRTLSEYFRRKSNSGSELRRSSIPFVIPVIFPLDIKSRSLGVSSEIHLEEGLSGLDLLPLVAIVIEI
jgi:hypothetical protein